MIGTNIVHLHGVQVLCIRMRCLTYVKFKHAKISYSDLFPAVI